MTTKQEFGSFDIGEWTIINDSDAVQGFIVNPPRAFVGVEHSWSKVDPNSKHHYSLAVESFSSYDGLGRVELLPSATGLDSGHILDPFRTLNGYEPDELYSIEDPFSLPRYKIDPIHSSAQELLSILSIGPSTGEIRPLIITAMTLSAEGFSVDVCLTEKLSPFIPFCHRMGWQTKII